MRTIAILVLGLSFAVGCTDEEARRQSLARQQLASIAEKFSQAERGFVPLDDQAEGLQAYRLQELTAAASELEPLVNQGGAVQQVAVRRLLAKAYLSTARNHARAAISESVALTSRGLDLINYLMAIDNTAIRARKLDYDESDLLSGLEASRREAQANQRDWAGKAQALGAQIKRLNQEVETLKGQRTQHLERARQLRDQAFNQEGQQQFDLSIQAVDAERNATKADKEIQLRLVTLEGLSSEHRVYEKQQTLAGELVQTLQKQISEAQGRQTEARQARDGALAEQKKLVAAMVEDFEKIFKDYSDAVDAGFARASEQTAKAVAVVEGAVSLARGEEVRVTRLDQLFAQVAQVYVLAHQIMAADGFSRNLSLVESQAGRLMPDREEYFRRSAAQVEEREVALAAEAKTLIAQAQALGNELAAGASEDELVRIATVQLQHLQNYQERIDQAQTR